MNRLFLRLAQPLPLDKPLQISKSDLSEIFSEARNYGVFWLLYVQLRRYNDVFSHGHNIRDYLEVLRPAFFDNAIRSTQQEAVEKEVLGFLCKKGIPAINFKGNAIAKEIYQDPNCRTSVDIDFLIKQKDAPRVDEIMLRAGYSRTDDRPVEFWLSRLHHSVYVHPKGHDVIEMHWNFAIPYLFNLSSEEIWNGVTYTDTGRPRLPPEMVLISLLIHHWMHAFGELRILLDIVWTLYTYEKVIDPYLFSRRLRKIGLVKTTRLTLNQMQNIFQESLKEIRLFPTLKDELKSGYKASGLLLSFFKIDIEKSDFEQQDKGNLIIRFALDRWPIIIFSFFKTFFPFPGAIKELYDDRRNCFLPFNYMRFFVWRLRDWKG